MDFGKHGAGRSEIQANGVLGRKKAQKIQPLIPAHQR